MKKLILFTFIVFILNIGLNAKDLGENLFIQKCAICHTLEIPKDRSKMVAPPARGIMFHMNEAFQNSKQVRNHILDFTINPTKEKAICRSVRRFGLMPSQKDLITKEELKIVAKWMINNLSMSKKEHNSNRKTHHNK